MKVVLSVEARADLREIAFFIARDDKDRARSFARTLRAKAEGIAEMPYAFPVLQRYRHLGIRRRSFRDYLILYRVQDDRIFILRIVNGVRDYEGLLPVSQD